MAVGKVMMVLWWGCVSDDDSDSGVYSVYYVACVGEGCSPMCE